MTDPHRDPDRIVQLIPAPGWGIYRYTGNYHQLQEAIAAWALTAEGQTLALRVDGHGNATPLNLDVWGPDYLIAHKNDLRLREPTTPCPSYQEVRHR